MFDLVESRELAVSATHLMRTSDDVVARCLRSFLQNRGFDPGQVVVGDLLPDELLYEGIVLIPDDRVFEFVLGVVEPDLQKTHPRPAQIAKWNEITSFWRESQWKEAVQASHWLGAQDSISQLVCYAFRRSVHVGDIAGKVRLESGADTFDEVIERSIVVLQHLFDEKLFRPGEMKRGAFVPWAVSPGEALQRIEKEWRALGRSPRLGEICWLEPTAAAVERARLLLSEAKNKTSEKRPGKA